MLKTKLLFALIAIWSLGACAVEDDEQPRSRAEREAALRDSAFGGLVEPMDRAQAVQELQIDRKSQLDAAIEN